MKTIGLIGGMSWESSIEYYRLINEGVRAKLGGHHSARSVMVSVDFAEIERYQQEGAWDEASYVLMSAAQNLEQAGADCIVLCTNTMHRLANDIQNCTTIPFIHIADPTAEKIKAAGIQKIGLLGTMYTMTMTFYANRVADHGLEVLIPGEADREVVHQIIYDELVLGKITAASRAEYQRIIKTLEAAGAEGIILGCTEIGLLVKAEDSELPLFDTTEIHAEAAVAFALQNVLKP